MFTTTSGRRSWRDDTQALVRELHDSMCTEYAGPEYRRLITSTDALPKTLRDDVQRADAAACVPRVGRVGAAE